MSCERRLNQSFAGAPVLPWNSSSRYVLFSDCHRGIGTHNDNFLKNQHLYFAALQYYYRRNYTYIELGDGDELWENRHMEQIKEIHNDAFWLLSLFYKENRLYMIYGNHDMMRKYRSFARKEYATFPCTSSQCEEPLFPDIHFHAGLILENAANHTRLYLTHGHQASILNSTLWPLNRFLVRYVWKPLEQIGILDPTSAAKNYTAKQRTEKKLKGWADKYSRTLITGHTHRPMIHPASSYLNTGSCIHPRCITCMEICGAEITLVKWYVRTKQDGTLLVERAELEQPLLYSDGSSQAKL